MSSREDHVRRAEQDEVFSQITAAGEPVYLHRKQGKHGDANMNVSPKQAALRMIQSLPEDVS